MWAANLLQAFHVHNFKEKASVSPQWCGFVELCAKSLALFCLCALCRFSPKCLNPGWERPITESPRIILSESRSPRVRDAQDLGAVSPEMSVPGVTLVFRRSAMQETALKDLLAAQQNPASPLYHRWLTPETFAARFGVADSDIAIAESWLVSKGFRIDNVARSRDRITFSGTAAQIQNAFGAELHHYRVSDELHFAQRLM